MISRGGGSVAGLNVTIAILHTEGLFLVVRALIDEVITLDYVILVLIDTLNNLNKKNKENSPYIDRYLTWSEQEYSSWP